jgi:hypothetical protein
MKRKQCLDNNTVLTTYFCSVKCWDVAAQYIGLCDDVLNEEDKPMVELAYDQIHPLKEHRQTRK